ncbi:hypothetical protein ACH5RR_030371 [Cinchona calisaya]|uniref:Uncharacterized protein n=1 Tax=Cinchona calisaya TaxID=153742 RepID=A0ABD2YY36_9GENT
MNSENPSNHPDHQVDVEQEEVGPISEVNNTISRNQEDADADRFVEIVLDIPYLLSRAVEVPDQTVNQDAAVEVHDQTVNRGKVPSRSGLRVRIMTASNGHNYSPPNKLSKVALTFFAQLAAVFMGNFLNNKQSSAASQHSHSYSPDWTIVIVTVTSLIGFFFTLISTSTSRIRSTTVYSVAAKFGFAAVAFVVIITIAMAVPLHPKAKIGLTAAVSLSALVVIALA